MLAEEYTKESDPEWVDPQPGWDADFDF